MKTETSHHLNARFRQIIFLLITIILSGLLTGCARGGALMQAPPVPAAQPGAVEGNVQGAESAAAEPVSGYAGDTSIDSILASAAAQVPETRVIIYTGDISLVVMDTEAAVEAITRLADEKGGYVASSNIYQAGDVPRGSITIRVPAERYQETLAGLRELAVRVERETSSTQDITEEFTDLQARKTNLEHAETALQKLLDERQQVGRTSDILEVYRELTNVRGQIEQIEGRLRYLTNQAALSTITVELIPDVLYQPVSVAGWEPQGVAKEALQTLVVALQGLANVLIWLVIFVLPLLIILLIPVVIVIWVIRRWWRRYNARKQVQPAAQ